MNQDPNAKPKRRRFRFSLRTLLVLVTIACAGFGLLGVKVRQALRQQQAVEAIEKLGGTVAYDYQFDANGNYLDSAKPPGPIWLRRLLGDGVFANVIHVTLMDTNATDGDLIHLQALPRVKQLGLGGTQVTDAGLAYVKGLTQLKWLGVADTKVTAEGCEALWKAIPKLEIWQ